jgi:biopolymer transport protein ExbD/biopolymer transport protein TolR
MAFEVGSGGDRRSRPAMNVTPLVDVVLVLLIIFMIVTPLLTKRFWVHVPAKDDPAAAPPPISPQVPVVLTLAADGSLRLNQERIEPADLAPRLGRVFAARSDRTLFFDAERGASYGRAVETMDVARGGGALTIAVFTKRPRTP